MAPRVLIEFPIEAAPQVRIICVSGTEERRLLDWILSHDEFAEILGRALELSEQERAA